MIDRLPESWIPPEHILDLRARVRSRHTLSHQRCEWQQRIQAVLYHHGCPHRRSLMVGDGREWLAAQPLPETAREQVTIAIAMIDALDRHIAPLDKELRAYARRQPGCKALMAHYGIGELTAVTILAELGDARRSPTAVTLSGTPAWTSPCTSQTSIARPASSPAKDHPRCVGRCMKPRKSRVAQAAPTAPTTCRPPSGSAATAPAWPSRASSSSAATTPCASSAIKRSCPPELSGARRALTHTDAPRPAPEDLAAATFAWTA